MFVLSQNPQPIKQIFKNSFALYKKIWRFIFILVILKALLSQISSFLLMGKEAGYLLQQKEIKWTVVFFMSLFALYLWAVIIDRSYNIMINKPADVLQQHLLNVLQKYWLYLTATFIYLVGVFCGFLLLILPGIFLVYLFSFYLLEILTNDKGIFSSLKRSAKLVWGNWWRVFIILVIPQIMGVFMIKAVDLIVKIKSDDWLINIWVLKGIFLVRHEADIN